MTDAELIARLMTIADTQERIENSEDRWKNPPYLPRRGSPATRSLQAASRLCDHRAIFNLFSKLRATARTY